MRERWWGSFASELHIRPWEIGELYVGEMRAAVASFVKQEAENRKRG